MSIYADIEGIALRIPASAAGLRAFFSRVTVFGDCLPAPCYAACMPTRELRPPKSKEVKADLIRISRYVADHPGCNLREMAELLGIAYDCVKKWKSKGWFAHQTPKEIREGVPPKPTIDTPRIGRSPRGKIPGEVVHRPYRVYKRPAIAGNERVYTPPVPPAQHEPTEPDVPPPENIKISSLRNQIKQRIMMNLRDSQAVSQYAAALKALAGVQDVELEEIYEQEKIIRIYCPAEEPLPDQIAEVEPIEY